MTEKSENVIPQSESVPAYWIFGRSKFQDYASLRREEVTSPGETLQPELTRLKPFRTNWPEDGHRAFRAVEKLARLPFLQGNQVELLIDGERTFKSNFEGIDAARDYLLVQFYIVRDDEQGREFQRRLPACTGALTHRSHLDNGTYGYY